LVLCFSPLPFPSAMKQEGFFISYQNFSNVARISFNF
jgi:hypothetical protein